MAYRDPIHAARVRVQESTERVDALEERITPALLTQLPDSLRDKLMDANVAATEAREDVSLEGLRAAVAALESYAELLEEAIRRAPKLARELNRLPRAYPERTRTYADYVQPDIFSTPLLTLRATLHQLIDRIDAKARLFDKRAGYFDSLATPYLVEACFRVDWNPLRLQVNGLATEELRTMGSFARVESHHCLLTGVRPSTPTLELTPTGVGSRLLTMVGLRRDTQVGDKVVDDAFVIDADSEDAERALRLEALTPLRKLMNSGEISVVEVKDGLARVEWTEVASVRTSGPAANQPFGGAGLEDAVALLVAIRRTPPTPLLRQLERRGGQKGRGRVS